MKIKTGLKAGNYIDSARHAVGKAGHQVSTFVNTAGTQAGSLANQVGSTWRSLTGKLS
jgi:hypothetical protein